MVRFGRQIENERIPEWEAGYVDYEALKTTLQAMITSGTVQTFSENSVYHSFSVATSAEILQPSGPGESDFMAQLDAEIDKVNAFTMRLHAELDAQTQRVQARHDAWVERGAPAEDAGAISDAVEDASVALQRFEDYINLNYIAFSKILKKHDKSSTCPYRMPYLLRIQSTTFVQGKMAHVVKAVSDMHASLQGRAAIAGASTFDENQKGGTSFVRRTSKYWVQTKDVLKVKMFLLKHLPIYKFTDGATDADLVSSVYFDDAQRSLYEGRLKKFDGAVALRIRWYGKEEGLSVAYVERKTHREDWFGDGEASAKERFPLPVAHMADFLSGRLPPERLRGILAEMSFRGDADAALALYGEVQELATRLGLRPTMRTQYMRTAFQRTGDATVRCSMDTELCMALEPCAPTEWKRSGALTSREQVTQFPHAVLELKMQIATGTEPPAWVAELLASGCLREVPKFSKFVHGTAVLNRASVAELPYWWSDEMMALWVDPFAASAGHKPLDTSARGLMLSQHGGTAVRQAWSRLGPLLPDSTSYAELRGPLERSPSAIAHGLGALWQRFVACGGGDEAHRRPRRVSSSTAATPQS